MFPMEYLNISQGVNNSYSHSGRLAIDICGKDKGIDAFYAPFTGTIKKIYGSDHVVWLESDSPVEYADGTVDYMTIMCMHDNDVSDLWVGKTIYQGQHFLSEGMAGTATGNHIHLECGKGKFTGTGWYENSYGKWSINNGINPWQALFLSDSTKIIEDYGYNWKRVSYTEPPTSPANIRSNKRVYNSSESITFYWDSVANATNYWIYLWKDGVQLYGTDMGMSTSYTSAPTSPGEYTLIVRAGNNIGYSNGGIPYQFTVTDTIPQPVTNMWSDKSEYKPGDDITFYWNEAYGAQEYWVYLWKDGSQLSCTCVGSNTSYTTTLGGIGKYTLVVRPSNINGFNEASVSHSVNVTNKNFKVNNSRVVYNTSESIEFSWNSVNGATNYWIYMWKDGKEIYYIDFGTNLSFTSAPTSAGDYTLIVRALNNINVYAETSFYFTVTNNIPEAVTNIYTEKNSYIPGETITYKWEGSYGAQNYWIYLRKDGIEYLIDCVEATQYTIPPAEVGTYTCIIRPSNVNGFNNDSVRCSVDVGKYYIEYDVNYVGNNAITAPQSQIKTYDDSMNILNTIPNRNNYKFISWNTKPDGSGISYNPGDLYTENKDLTLYAQWEELMPYTESIVTKLGTKLYVDTTTYNISDSCDILIAGYKGNNLVAMKKILYNEQNSPYTLEGDIDKIKVMVWNGLSNLMPLCDAEVIPYTEFIIE